MLTIRKCLLMTLSLVAAVVFASGCGGGGGGSAHGGATVLPSVDGQIIFGHMQNGSVIIYKTQGDGDILTEVTTKLFTDTPEFQRIFSYTFNSPIVIHVTTGRYADPSDGSIWELADHVVEEDNGQITLQSLGAVIGKVDKPVSYISVSVLTDLCENLAVYLTTENNSFATAATLAHTYLSDYFGFDINDTGMVELVGLTGDEEIDFDDELRYSLIQTGMLLIYRILGQQIDIALGNDANTTSHTDVMHLLAADAADGELDFQFFGLPIPINPDEDAENQIFFNQIPMDPEEEVPTFFEPFDNFLTGDLPDAIELWLDSVQNKTIWDTDDLVVQQFITSLRSKNGLIRPD